MSKKTTTKKTTKKKRAAVQQKHRQGVAQPVTISIARGLLERIDAEAERLEVNRSAFITAALEDFLESSVSQLKFFRSPGVMRAMVDAFSKPGVMSALATALGEELDSEKTQQVLDFMKQAGAQKETR